MAWTRIEGRRGFPRLNLHEVWDFRELLMLMVWKDLRIRYKQTILGLLWAILPTLFSGLLFSVIFGRLAGLGSEGLPYPAFFFAAAVPWNLFAGILTQTAISLTGNTHLLTKVYFPRLVLPLKTTLVALVDCFFASFLIIGSMIYYGLAPSPDLAWLPVFLLLAVVTGLGLGLWFATLNAYFRDIGLVLPYLVQIGFFLTPIIYSASLFHEPWRTLQKLNPMASVVTGFRWCLLGVGAPPDGMVALSFLLALALAVSGAYFFRRVERTIVDIICEGVYVSTLAIKVEKLGKEYAIGAVENSYPTLRDAVVQMFRSPVDRLANVLRGRGAWARRETFWALRDVSFEIEQGTVVGVIGRNGAGKSTLLKVLSRITDPTEGWAELRGRVGSLLEVGTGFHPELTGRENIFMSGAMLGMKRHEIHSCFDDIVAFSEVGQFLETPVKHYSSGMYTRLAFAVAAHLNPEILIVDEVLAVGDAAFQKKCLGKMDAVSRAGKTVLFVSHQMSAIENMCKACIWLDRGQVRRIGPTAEVLSEYLRDLSVLQTSSLTERTDRRGTGDVRFTGVELQDATGQEIPALVSGEPALLVLHFENRLGRDLHNASFAISIDDHLTNRLTSLISQFLVEAPEVIPAGVRTVAFRVPRLPLIPGKYSYTLFAQVNGIIADWVRNAGEFFVDGGDFYGSGKLPHSRQGHFLMDYQFEVKAA